MPRLPSGIHVGITIEPVIDAIRKGNLGTHLSFLLGVQSHEEMSPVISLVYYRGEQDVMPSDPYLPGLTILDAEEDRCGWSDEDAKAFRAWQATPRMQDWLKNSFSQLLDAINETQVELPTALHGIMEG